MLPKNRMIWFLTGVAASMLIGGCAVDAIRSGQVTKHYRREKTENAVARNKERAEIETGSIAKGKAPVTSKDDPRWQWCEQRHVEYQAGMAPGGATDLAKKLEDDRTCASVYQRR